MVGSNLGSWERRIDVGAALVAALAVSWPEGKGAHKGARPDRSHWLAQSARRC